MMERALKERIIGAVVLVVFVVLNDGEIVSERVLLPGQEEQKTQTVVLDRDRTKPVPNASVAAPANDEPVRDEAVREEPEPVVSKPDDPEPKRSSPAQAEPEPATVQPAASSTGMWAVQLGSFSNKENAEKLAADLRKQGYAAFLSQLQTANGQLHRVRIGPQKDRQSAEAMAARLAKADHEGQVVPHP
jgi:DedD protein